MGLESGTFIQDLVASNPDGSDLRAVGDDHLRLIKNVLRATFPNADKAFYFPDFAAKAGSWSVLAADHNKTFLVDTTTLVVTATLPTLAAADDGWTCHFIKANTGLNPLFIAPAAGTLQSGEVPGIAKCRRVIPGHRCSAIWSGTAWFVTRNVAAPVGGFLSGQWPAVPVGFELPNGQTLASAATNYPEFFLVNGNSGVAFDLTGRVEAMIEAAATRLTNVVSGVDGATLGDDGGEQAHTLTIPETPIITPAGSVVVTLSSPFIVGVSSRLDMAAGGGVGVPTNPTTPGALATFTGTPHGGGGGHNNVQPTIVVRKLLVVE